MHHVAIFGCGYTGRALARRLLARGLRVAGTTTTESNLPALAALGVRGHLIDPADPETWHAPLRSARAVVHLAPPSDRSGEEHGEAFARSCASAEVVVYGSTTGAFGQPDDPSAWVDEQTVPQRLGERGARRLAVEHALEAAGLPVKVVRIAGIYGPGRTLRDSIIRDALVLFEGAPHTSRVHVEDLARILEAMLKPTAPPLVIACDEEPAPTLDVARYTCGLLGLAPPTPIPQADAMRVLSSRAREMRLQGRRCRSLYREGLIGPLAYPTYREGVRASLEAEGITLDRVKALP